jgi:hypothetical protein
VEAVHRGAEGFVLTLLLCNKNKAKFSYRISL